MPSASHVSNITVNTFLEALATPGAGFGTVTLMVDEAQGTGNPLNTDSTPTKRYIDFADYAQAQDASDASEISAEVLAACLVAFSQPLAPSAFRVCRVDTGGAETYSSAYTLLLAEDGVQGDLWAFCMDSRDATEQADFAEIIEATDHILYLAASEADAKTSGLPAAWLAAWPAMGEGAQSGGVYHDVTTEWADVATMCRWLAFDPDLFGKAGEDALSGVGDYDTYVIKTVKDIIQDNNIGVLGTWGSTDYWVSPVVSFDGRPLYDALTARWMEVSIEERVQTLVQREHAAGRKVLVTPTGQRQVGAAIQDVLRVGASVGHFAPGQVVITYPTITDADRSARRLVVNVEAQIGISTINFTFNNYLSTSPVVS